MEPAINVLHVRCEVGMGPRVIKLNLKPRRLAASNLLSVEVNNHRLGTKFDTFPMPSIVVTEKDVEEKTPSSCLESD